MSACTPCKPPLYTTFASVKVRLANKIQFQSGKEPEQGELPDELLSQLVSDAETQVEQDLRGRYAIPFQSKSRGTFKDLPDHSARAIRMAVDMQAVMQVLRTDFGRGTHINAEDYFESAEKAYKSYITTLLGRDQEGANDKRDRFRFTPPLDDLLLAYQNREADDGFKGKLINTDGSTDSAETYAAQQINDPSKTWIKRRGWGGL